MEKLIYVLRREGEAADARFAPQLLDEAVPAIRRAGGRDLTVNVADLNDRMDTPRTRTPRIYGHWPQVLALVHLWLDSLDERAPVEAALATLGRPEGYLVTESVVQRHERSWADGERRPGVTQVALGRKPAGMSDAHFFHHWQVVHSSWSFELHPLRQSYVRNAVARVLTAGAPELAFIVLEHWRELEQFTDEDLYYRSDAHVRQLWQDAPDFLDLDRYEGGPASEYHYR